MFSVKDQKYGLQIIIFATTNGKIIDILGVFAGWSREVAVLNALSNQSFMQYKNKNVLPLFAKF